MPNNPKITFTEPEVRMAYVIGIATGRTIDEINAKIIGVTANNRAEIDKETGLKKVVDGTSKLALALEALRNCGYISNH